MPQYVTCVHSGQRIFIFEYLDIFARFCSRDNGPADTLELRSVAGNCARVAGNALEVAGCKLPPKCKSASSMCVFVRLPPNTHLLPEQHSSSNFLPHPLLRGGCGRWQHNSHAPKHPNPMEVDFCLNFVFFLISARIRKKCSYKQKLLERRVCHKFVLVWGSRLELVSHFFPGPKKQLAVHLVAPLLQLGSRSENVAGAPSLARRTRGVSHRAMRSMRWLAWVGLAWAKPEMAGDRAR